MGWLSSRTILMNQVTVHQGRFLLMKFELFVSGPPSGVGGIERGGDMPACCRGRS